MKKKHLTRLLIAVFCLFIAASSFAMPFMIDADEEESYNDKGGKHNGEIVVDPVSQEEGYSAVLYNNTNGLPTSEANDIVETAEGFIWIGSYAGLIRYDGSRFERISSTSGITSVKCLYVDSRGKLWIGTNDNGVILMDNGKYYHWGLEDGLKSLSVRSIVEGPDEKIYVATTEGMVVIDRQMKLSYVEDLRLIDAFLHELRVGADGKIYALSNSGDIFELKDGKVLKQHRLSQSDFKGVNCFLPDPENPDLIYVETQNGTVYHDTLASGFTESEPIDIAPLDQVQSFEYLYGDVWICARNGIGVLDENGFHILQDVPMKNSVGHVMSDYEGNLWFTSTREGVMKIVSNRFTDLFKRYDLSSRVVNSTCLYEDDLYIATDTGLIVVNKSGVKEKVALNESFEIFNSEEKTDNLIELLDNCRIRSIISDSKGRLWISTWRRYGLLCFDHGELISYKTEDGMASDSIRTIYECDDGRILVAGNGGVSVIRNGKVIRTYTEKDGIINTDILSVTQGENNDIIIGTDGAGIYIIGDDGMRHIDHKNGLSSENVMRIKPDKGHEVYWVITGNSLSYLTRDYELKKADLFPYSNNFDLYENSKGELWVLCSNGIYITKADDILEGNPINAVHYSMSDGLPCITTANSYSELTENGDLYISGTTGAAKVNIEEPFGDIGELLFAIPYVEADGTMIYPDEFNNFTIPSDTRKLTIYGYVYTYSLTEPLISCRLDGFDKENTVGKASEIFPIYYTNLPGGTYLFFMELRNSLSEATNGTFVKITKEKAMYEHRWFYIYAALDSLIAIFIFVSLYEDARERKLEKKHKEESEKQALLNELKMGNDIQRSSLPHIFPPFPDRDEFELYAIMDPAKEVGGDFYDFFFIDEDHLCLLMADVSGKGIPGALFMMVSKAILANAAMFSDSPAKILEMTNESICANNQAKMFVTVWLGILEVSTGKMKAANAGHEYPIICEPDGKFEMLKDKHGLVIGAMENFVYTEYDLHLKPGSKLFLYTDGIPEATDSKNRLFGMERLLNALNKEPEANPQEIMANVRKAVDAFVKEAEQFDDLTMMCIEYKGKTKKQK